MITINLSQSAFSYHGCILELYRKCVEGYYELPSANIVYGTAIHKYVHIMYQTGGHIPTAREEALKEFNAPKIPAKRGSTHLDDPKHMLATAFMFFESYIKEDKNTEVVLLNGKPATEVSFSMPFYQDEHVNVNWCGTIDKIAKIKNGCYILPDIKTTSSWDKNGYFSTYKLSRQLRGYVLALRLMARHYPTSILGQIGMTHIGTRIDGCFIKPSSHENKYIASDINFYDDSDIAEYEKMLLAKCKELSECVRLNYFPKQGILNSSCSGKWGLCSFANVCAVNDNVGRILLERDFKKKEFNPLNYGGGLE